MDNSSKTKELWNELQKDPAKFTKRVAGYGTNLFGLIILRCLYIIKPFNFVKLCLFSRYCDRIGHLASEPDLFLRRLQLENTPKKRILYLGIVGKPANQQLLKMFRRKLFIIENPLLHGIVNGIVNRCAPLRKSIFYGIIPLIPRMTVKEFSNTEPNLHFSESEEVEGKNLLNKMGIDDNSWFICFHSRDAAYLEKYHSHHREECSYFRNTDVKNYLEAAKYIASLGGFAVRMGFGVAEKLPNLNNPRIIDYASYHRTDFGDIYLPAKCKFFLGNTSGLWMVPTIFHVPVACANFIPLELTPFRKGDLYIPPKIWSIKKKRFLTFREILDSEIGRYQHGKLYAEAGLEVVENTAEEILDLAKEMNERLDGNFEYTEEDEELQNRFRSLFQPHHYCYGTPARIGAKFLRQNKEL